MELHQQLEALRPNAVFTSNVKRPTEDMRSQDPQNYIGAPGTTFTMTSSSLKTGGSHTAASQRVPYQKGGLRLASNLRPGQDEGFLGLRAPKNVSPFNSTSPRFNYRKEEEILGENPGAGSYDYKQDTSFMTTQTFHAQNSVFKDQTERMDDLKGYRGYQRHQN